MITLALAELANNRLIRGYVASLPDCRFFDRLQNVPHGDDAERQLQPREGSWGRGQQLSWPPGHRRLWNLLRRGDRRGPGRLVAKNPNAFNVIIFLSDGDANASSSNVPSGQAKNQCHEGITAAQTATKAGTVVYTAAYGSPTGVTPSSCSTDTGTGMAISACTAMQSMASTPSTFFSDTTGTTCTSTITANSASDLVALFNGIASR